MKRDTDFDQKVATYAKYITQGCLVSMDPGSVTPGYAVFQSGELVRSGVLKLRARSSIQDRLQDLAVELSDVRGANVDVFAIEKIRGAMAHVYLQWSVGVAISMSGTHRLLEVPIYYWKAYVKSSGDYTAKGDEADAIAIGRTVIKQAREYLNEYP